MALAWFNDFDSLLEAGSPAVLTTYRRNGTAVPSPVWYRFHDEAFEVVLAEGDIKLRHLARNPHCSLLIFESIAPFRGLRVEGEPTLPQQDVTPVRRSIASRYLGPDLGARFAAERSAWGVVLTLPASDARTWGQREPSSVPRHCRGSDRRSSSG
jgi:Pyridoxamine 5'-phosphate oxidase